MIELTVAVVIDRTGSSRRVAEGIRLVVGATLSSIEKLAPAANCWVQSHGDEDCGELPELLTDGGSIALARTDIGGIQYAGGGDLPETHLSAIERFHGIVPWGRRNLLLLIATDESKPASSGRSAAEIGTMFRTGGIAICAVCQPTPRMTEFVTAAAGTLIEISNNPDLSEIERVSSVASRSVAASIRRPSTQPAARQ